MNKKFCKIIRAISLVTALTFIFGISLVSCSEKEETGGEEYVEFTDALGQQIKIRKNPERVAALIGSFADVWMLSGGKLCAAAEDAWSDFGLELEGAVNIGGAHSPSLELLLSSNPDLVIASSSTASNVNMKDTL